VAELAAVFRRAEIDSCINIHKLGRHDKGPENMWFRNPLSTYCLTIS
jgi:hypothetical protein